ncbi:hypothetical protein QE152_g9170 [Popillia japonica]|uniref:Uncharacterized protein n=1 Tax=Popillia japonica TaxID=7064 RepID=A0AAW1LY20_POPJA
MEEAKKKWFFANKLYWNSKKTQQLDFSMSRRLQSGSIKVLGLHMDSKLSRSAHIDETAKELSAAVFSIRKIKYVATASWARLAYLANFHHIAMYRLQFWRMAAEADRIFKLQKKEAWK